jgi:hypothetical protein
MQVDEALALWDEFPVRREPRLIVLMDAAIGPGRLPRIEDRQRVLVHADGLPIEVMGAG